MSGPVPAGGGPRLLVYFARVGDLVLLTPALRVLAAEAPVHLLARPWAAPLLAGQPWLAATHVLARPNVGILRDWFTGGERARLGTRLAAMPWSEILVFAGERPAVRRWIDSWRGEVPVRVLRPDPIAHPHSADRFLAAVSDQIGPDADARPRLEVPAAARAAAGTRLALLGRRVIGLQAGSSLTDRWFRRRPNLKGLAPGVWAGVLAELLAEGDADAVVALGTRAERGEAQAIRALVPEALRDRVHDWTGEVPLADLPAVMAGLAACLSVDTGPAHIAAAVSCPTLVVFGPTTPGEFAPRGPGRVVCLEGAAPCRPCHGTSAFRRCRANRCMEPLTAAVLTAAARRLLAPVAV